MEVFSFEKGPLIQIQFHTVSNLVQKIKLTLSHQFEVCLLGSPSKKNRGLILKWIQFYLNKSEAGFPLPLNFSSFSPYQKEVYASLSQVPFGVILSYKELALRTNSPKAIRAVGSSCRNNLFPLVIPCHRVIRSDQTIGQFNGGVEIKKRLLDFEEALHFCAVSV